MQRLKKLGRTDAFTNEDESTELVVRCLLSQQLLPQLSVVFPEVKGLVQADAPSRLQFSWSSFSTTLTRSRNDRESHCRRIFAYFYKYAVYPSKCPELRI